MRAVSEDTALVSNADKIGKEAGIMKRNCLTGH
jgi:hypothetical protein